MSKDKTQPRAITGAAGAPANRVRTEDLEERAARSTPKTIKTAPTTKAAPTAKADAKIPPAKPVATPTNKKK